MSDDTRLTHPFRAMAMQYLDAGLGSPIPSAIPLAKRPPLTGWTGKRGKRPDRSHIEAWSESHEDSNVLLRLARDVVGIDTDAYDLKRGAETFVAVSCVHGALPPTWRSTARHNDVMSGIRFFRLTDEMDQSDSKSDFGPRSDTEIIRAGHRFACVYPSWHHDAKDRYRWYDLDGVMVDEWIVPNVDDLPFLPSSWWGHVTQTCSCFEQVRRARKAQTKRYENRPHGAEGRHGALTDFIKGVDTLAEMPEGSRNTFLSKLAGHTYRHDVLGSMALDYQEVTEVLWEAARKAGLDDDEIGRTLDSADSWAVEVAS